MTRDEMGALYDQYSGTVYRVALSYCRNVQDAEDVMQEVFLKRFTLDRSFPDEGQEKAWLIRMTVNRCKNLLKAIKRRRGVPLEDAAGLCVNDEETGIWEAVASLPAKYRLVIRLYYGEGYSVGEIAAMLRRSETAVQTQLYRARRLLKDILGEEVTP
ncbi:MAG: RNA polymerase sigma factor [Oscillospiraceae bacterium]|nr:RNA polymerase sigma factor [Oscillospiraceae bacterium]